jgi:hypothetical protein
MAASRDGPRRNNGKLKIALPFEDALKAATQVPADSIPPPEPKRKPHTKKKP